MEAAFEFAVNGEIMEFARGLIRNGRTIPAALFIDILTEKCQLLNKHLHSTRDCLMIVACITNDTASIKFHDIHYEISEMRHVTLSNMPDLEDQLKYLWTEMRDFLHYFHIDDHAAELASIDTFYRELEYNQMVQANFML